MQIREQGDQVHRLIRTSCKVFWVLFCVIGLAYHLQTVCDGYFRYATATDTVIDIPTRFRPPALTVCFDARSIIRKAGNSESVSRTSTEASDCSGGGSSSGSGTGPGSGQANAAINSWGDACPFLMNNMSLSEVANRTYDFDDVVQQIWYRDPVDYAAVLLNQSSDPQEFQFYLLTHVRTRFKGKTQVLCRPPHGRQQRKRAGPE